MKKVLFTFLSCFVLLLAMPKDASAATSFGHRANGSSVQQDAYNLSIDKNYYDYAEDAQGKYYKFKTGSQDGIYLISLLAMVQGAQNTTNRCTSYIKVVDRYGTTVAEASAGQNPADYRIESVGGVSAKAMDLVLPVEDLASDTYYYIFITGNDGSNAVTLNILNYFNVEFVPFRTANDFYMYPGENGSLSFTWSNDQPYNTYNALTPYDGFVLEMSQGKNKRTQYVGNGGTTKYTLGATDKNLVKLGYPAKSIEIRLGCIQNYHSIFNEDKICQKIVYSDDVFTTNAIPKNTEILMDGLKYKITNPKSGKGTVTVAGFSNEKSKAKTVTIGETIKYGGFTYKITSISKKAFAENKHLTEVTLGKNITTIGEKSFFNCKELKKVVIKSTGLKKVNKKAFENISTHATIKVPKKSIKAYRRLLRGKYKKGVKIKK